MLVTSVSRLVPGMVAIPPGTFEMGSDASFDQPYFNGPLQQPVHAVTISQAFWMGEHEVTQAEYEALMGSNPSLHVGPDRPVDLVSWDDAVAYCQALTAQETALGNVPAGYQYRLPTEAEWEYACRAGTTTVFNLGDELFCADAWFKATFHAFPMGCGTPSRSTDVGSYAPNAWGLFDMHGNVWEWTLDVLHNDYPTDPVTDPLVLTGAVVKVFRGGGWNTLSAYCASAYRGGGNAATSAGNRGFRIVLAPVVAF